MEHSIKTIDHINKGIKNMRIQYAAECNQHDQTSNKLPFKIGKGSQHAEWETNKIRPEYFTSFYYNDNITNNSMPINTEYLFENLYKKHNENSKYKGRLSHKQENQAPRIRTKQSFDLMRQTRRFHLNQIQSRNYRNKLKNTSVRLYTKGNEQSSSYHEQLVKSKFVKYLKNRHQQKQNFSKDRHMLSKILQNYKVSLNANKSEITQANQIQVDDQHSIPNISSYNTNQVAKHQENKEELGQDKSKQNRNNMEKQKEKKKKNEKKTKVRNQGSLQMKENEIINNIKSELRYFVRKNRQFLITPKLNNRLIIKSNNYDKKNRLSKFKEGLAQSQMRKSDQEGDKGKKYFNKQQLQSYEFKASDSRQLIRRRQFQQEQTSSSRDLRQKQLSIISAIQAGNYFKVQIQLSLSPQLLLTKQSNNLNNLLHMCIMSNKEAIFQMILRKSRQNNFDLLFQKNKYGRSPLQLGNILSFFRNQNLINLIQIVQKERIQKCYSVLGQLFIN